MGNGAAAVAGAQPAQVKSAKKKRKNFLAWITESPPWAFFIFLCIVANAAILGYDAHYGEHSPYHAQIEVWNNYFLWIFTGELVLEFLAQGPRKYFRNGWNWFDVIVVALSYIAVNPAISALRTLRIVRVFRLVSAVPQMRRVVEALFGALPGILAAFAILSVVFYIAAVMGTTLFHRDEGFHDLGAALFSLFALSQFDGWGETMARLQTQNPYAWVYVIGFTVIAAFAVLNLFIGVIVEAVQSAPKEIERETMEGVEEVGDRVQSVQEAQDSAAEVQRRILEELRSLRADVNALKSGGASGPQP